MRSLLAVAFAALVCAGCVTIGNAQPASTLGRGNVNGGVEGSIWGYAAPNSGLAWLPAVNGFVRFGVHDRFDLGLRAGGTGFELQTKVQITDPDAERFVFSVAITPQGAYLPATSSTNMMTGQTSTTPSVGRLAFPISAMFGIKLGNHELVFAAREVNDLYFVRDNFPGAPLQQLFTVNLGASAGFALRLGNSFIMMPEIAFQAPVWVSLKNEFGTGSAFGTPLVQFTGGVSFIFGKMRPRADAPPPPPEENRPPPPSEDYTPPPLPPDVAPVPPPPPPPET